MFNESQHVWKSFGNVLLRGHRTCAAESPLGDGGRGSNVSAVSSPADRPMRKLMWGETDKGVLCFDPVGTTQDISVNSVCSVMTSMCHTCYERMPTTYDLFQWCKMVIQVGKSPRWKTLTLHYLLLNPELNMFDLKAIFHWDLKTWFWALDLPVNS